VFLSEILLFEVSMETHKHIALRKDASLDLDVTEISKRRDYLKLHNLIRYKKIQQGLVSRRGYVLGYLVVNRIVVKRVLFKWFKLR